MSFQPVKTLSNKTKKPAIVLPEVELSAPSTSVASKDEIRGRAYSLYLAEGRPEGREVEHWLAAEADCQATMKTGGEAPGSSEAEMAEMIQAKAAKKPSAARPRARKTAAAW